MGALNVLMPTLRPRATENVPAMIAVIEKLIANGAAYAVPSGVYFSVARMKITASSRAVRKMT
jgi:cysteinyl-tRNA synthetase